MFKKDGMDLRQNNVILREYDKYGKLLRVITGHNDMLITGKINTAILITSGDPDKVITKCAFGDAGHDPSEPTEPLLIDESTTIITGLNNELLQKPHSGFSIINSTEIVFNLILNSGELVGELLSEIALLSEDGDIFATYRFGQLPKGNTTLKWEWHIRIS